MASRLCQRVSESALMILEKSRYSVSHPKACSCSLFHSLNTRYCYFIMRPYNLMIDEYINTNDFKLRNNSIYCLIFNLQRDLDEKEAEFYNERAKLEANHLESCQRLYLEVSCWSTCRMFCLFYFFEFLAFAIIFPYFDG